MPLSVGNTGSSFTSTAYNIPTKIIGFSLANKTGGSITVSIGVLLGSTYDILYNHALSAGQEYVYSGEPIIVPANYQIAVGVSGSTDYLITVETL